MSVEFVLACVFFVVFVAFIIYVSYRQNPANVITPPAVSKSQGKSVVIYGDTKYESDGVINLSTTPDGQVIINGQSIQNGLPQGITASPVRAGD